MKSFFRKRDKHQSKSRVCNVNAKFTDQVQENTSSLNIYIYIFEQLFSITQFMNLVLSLQALFKGAYCVLEKRSSYVPKNYRHQFLNRECHGCTTDNLATSCFPPLFPFLHCPLRFVQLQVCSFHDVVVPCLPLSTHFSSPFTASCKMVLEGLNEPKI